MSKMFFLSPIPGILHAMDSPACNSRCLQFVGHCAFPCCQSPCTFPRDLSQLFVTAEFCFLLEKTTRHLVLACRCLPAFVFVSFLRPVVKLWKFARLRLCRLTVNVYEKCMLSLQESSGIIYCATFQPSHNKEDHFPSCPTQCSVRSSLKFIIHLWCHEFVVTCG